MSDIEYREATESDANALVELWWNMQSSHEDYDPKFYKNIGEDNCKTFWIKRFWDLLTDKKSFIHIATASAKPIGMIIAQFTTRPPVYEKRQCVAIASTIVHPQHRRQGVFHNLLRCVEEKARSNGIEMIEITVDRDNPGKLAYEKAGFSVRQEKMIKWLR